MKTLKRILIVIFLVFYNQILFSEWKQINFDPSILDLEVASIASENVAVAAGENGCVAVTTNGGTSWNYKIMTGNERFISALCIDETNFLVGGANGAIYKSSDQGINWVRCFTDTSGNIEKMAFLNNFGLAASSNGAILITNDLGLNWQQVSYWGNTEFHDITWIDGQNAIAVADGIAIKSNDGGNSWDSLKTGFNFHFRRIASMPNNHLLILGDSLKCIYSDDGGLNWIESEVEPDYTSIHYVKPQIIGFNFFDAETGIIRVEDVNSYIPLDYEYLTTDGGKTWIAKDLDEGWFTDNGIGSNFVIIKNENTGYSVGYNGSIYKVTIGADGFCDYIELHSSSSKYFTKIKAGDENNIVVLGNSGSPNYFYTSSDAGQSWNFSDLKIKGFDGGIASVESFSIPSQGYVFLACNNRTEVKEGNNTITYNQGFILMSEDSGKTYSEYRYPYKVGFNDINMIDINNGYVLLSNGVIYTTDGGENWISLPEQDTNYIQSKVYSEKAGVFYINAYKQDSLGFHYALFKTSDFGINWEMINSKIPAYYDKFIIKDELYGWAVGRKYIEKNRYIFIAKTFDDGRTWIEKYFDSSAVGSTTRLSSIGFNDINHFIAVGSYKPIIRTTNGGDTWIFDPIENISLYNSMIDIAYPKGNLAIAISTDGKIFLNNDLPTDVNETINKSSDMLVYPNPATGIINISLNTKSDKIEIEISDYLGKNIYKSEHRTKIGLNELNINTGIFNSGYYLIKLTDKHQITCIPVLILK